MPESPAPVNPGGRRWVRAAPQSLAPRQGAVPNLPAITSEIPGQSLLARRGKAHSGNPHLYLRHRIASPGMTARRWLVQVKEPPEVLRGQVTVIQLVALWLQVGMEATVAAVLGGKRLAA